MEISILCSLLFGNEDTSGVLNEWNKNMAFCCWIICIYLLIIIIFFCWQLKSFNFHSKDEHMLIAESVQCMVIWFFNYFLAVIYSEGFWDANEKYAEMILKREQKNYACMNKITTSLIWKKYFCLPIGIKVLSSLSSQNANLKK